jgi:hypothetical protein
LASYEGSSTAHGGVFQIATIMAFATSISNAFQCSTAVLAQFVWNQIGAGLIVTCKKEELLGRQWTIHGKLVTTIFQNLYFRHYNAGHFLTI